MIVYGSRAVNLKTNISSTAVCSNCNTKGLLKLSTYRKHAHIFWIPLFPIGSVGMSECQNCKQVLEFSEMQAPLKREYKVFKSDVKGPIWQFSGLTLILLLFVWGIYSSKQNDILKKEYISAPLVGDTYDYKVIETSNYSILKVREVSQDSVFVSPNEYEISKRSKLYTINKEENYTSFNYGISRANLEKMYDKGRIISIDRN